MAALDAVGFLSSQEFLCFYLNFSPQCQLLPGLPTTLATTLVPDNSVEAQ